MADDTYTEVTSQSWFSRIGDSIKGIVFGAVLFAGSFFLLFWNEGRAVKTYNTLNEGSKIVRSVRVDAVDAANEGALVHMSGKADTAETLQDSEFGMSAKALRLNRVAEMYQWKESESTKTEKKAGGGSTTTTTYSYDKGWHDELINSSEFKKSEEHRNPRSMPVGQAAYMAGVVAFGAFTLPGSLVGKITTFTPLPASQTSAVPVSLGAKGRICNGMFYVGADPASPQIGDVRVSFKVVLPLDVSIVARQIGSTFEPYATKAGGTIELLGTGVQSAEALFAQAQARNRMLTWLLRLAGFLAMMIGLNLVFKPLSVVADVLPFLGDLVGMGTGLASFLIAAVLSLATVSIAWIVFRPVLGIALLACAVALAFVLQSKFRKSKKGA